MRATKQKETRTLVKTTRAPNKQQSVDDLCECEVLCASDLSDVDSEDCDCDDCLQAMATAYNEYLEEESKTKHQASEYFEDSSYAQEKNNNRSTHHHDHTHSGLDIQKQEYAQDRRNIPSPQRNKPHQHHPRCTRNLKCCFGEEWQLKYAEQETMKRVRQRMQENLQRHRLLGRQQRKEKAAFMARIKQDMQKLRYVAKIALQKCGQKTVEQENRRVWGYQPLGPPKLPKKSDSQDGENNINNNNGAKEEHCHKIPLKKRTDTGQANFQLLKEFKFLNEIKRRVKEELRNRKHNKKHGDKPGENKCKYDTCKNHHMSTPSQQIEKTRKKIQKNAEKYLQQVKKQQKAKEDQQRILKAKLKAIGLEARRKLEMSKKQPMDSQITTFDLEIDNFKTFEQLKKNNEVIQQERSDRRKASSAKSLKKDLVPGNQNILKEIAEDRQELHEEVPTPDTKNRLQLQSQQKRAQKLQSIKNTLKTEGQPQKPQPQQLAPPPPPESFGGYQLPNPEKQLYQIFSEAGIPLSKKSVQKNASTDNKAQKETASNLAINYVSKMKQDLKQINQAKKQKKIQQLTEQRKQEILNQYRLKQRQLYKQIDNKNKKNKKTSQNTKTTTIEDKKSKAKRPATAENTKIKSVNPIMSERSLQKIAGYEHYHNQDDQDQILGLKNVIGDPHLNKMQTHKDYVAEPDHMQEWGDILTGDNMKVFKLGYDRLAKQKQLII